MIGELSECGTSLNQSEGDEEGRMGACSFYTTVKSKEVLRVHEPNSVIRWVPCLHQWACLTIPAAVSHQKVVMNFRVAPGPLANDSSSSWGSARHIVMTIIGFLWNLHFWYLRYVIFEIIPHILYGNQILPTFLMFFRREGKEQWVPANIPLKKLIKYCARHMTKYEIRYLQSGFSCFSFLS